jgi:hypothetical protein
VKKGKLGQDDEKQAEAANGERDKEESKRKSEERKTGAGKEPSGTANERKGSLLGRKTRGDLRKKVRRAMGAEAQSHRSRKVEEVEGGEGCEGRRRTRGRAATANPPPDHRQAEAQPRTPNRAAAQPQPIGRQQPNTEGEGGHERKPDKEATSGLRRPRRRRLEVRCPTSQTMGLPLE